MNRRVGVILSYILMFFEVISTLFLTPFIIRTLGQAEYGVYKLTIAINTYLLLLDLGVGNATIRYISKYRAKNDKTNEGKFLGVATIYYFIIAILVMIIGIVIVVNFPSFFAKGLTQAEIDLGQKLLFITMITSAIVLGTSAYNNILIAYEKFSISKGCTIIQIILKIIITYIVLKKGMNSYGIVIVNLLLTIFLRVYFVFYVIVKMKIKPIFKNINSKFIKEVVMYSSLILLQMIPTQLNFTIDQILIGSIVASSSIILAIYGIGSQITQYFQTIGSAFTGVLMPGIVKMVENNASKEQITNEMVRIGRIILMVLILIWGVFLIEGKEFIYLWAGKENLDAFIVAIILMSAHMFVLVKSVGTQILWAMNEHKEQAFLKFFIVLINIILTIFLIKWNPLLGATIGTFISILLGDIFVMDIIFYKKLKVDIIRYYKDLAKGIIPSIILAIICGYIINNFITNYSIVNLILKSIIMCIVYFITMWIFGLNKDEKELISSILKLKRKVN